MMILKVTVYNMSAYCVQDFVLTTAHALSDLIFPNTHAHTHDRYKRAFFHYNGKSQRHVGLDSLFYHW